MIDPTIIQILEALADLVEEDPQILDTVYNLDPTSSADLDLAVWDWIAAGAPMATASAPRVEPDEVADIRRRWSGSGWPEMISGAAVFIDAKNDIGLLLEALDQAQQD